MKRKLHIYGIGACLLLLSACGGKKERDILIDLDQSFNEKNLKMSELAENIRCIPLETNGEFIIPDNSARYWVFDKYIIVASDRDIRLFSPEGKHIRRLATAGKGPDEYTNLISCTVDEERDILYYGHWGDRENISAVNLKDGRQMKKISTRFMPAQMQTVKGNILCAAHSYGNRTGCDMLLLTPEGKVLDSIPSEKKAEQITLIPDNGTNNLIFRNDSLLRFDFNKGFTPVMAFKYGDKFNPANHLKGVTWNVLFFNGEYAVAQRTALEVNISGKEVSAKKNIDRQLFIPMKDLRPSQIGSIYIDPIGRELKGVRLSLRFTGKKLVHTVSAFELKELARAKRENGETLPPALKQLDERLTEESNPVLIIGDLK